MAGVNKTDIPEIAAFMPDLWTFMKSVWVPEDNEVYWEDVNVKAATLEKKHRDGDKDGFCQAMILFIMDYLEWKQESRCGKVKTNFAKWLYMRYAQRARMENQNL